MEAIREILPSLIGDRKVKKSRRRAPLGEGTRPLFPPRWILQPSGEWIGGPLLVNRTKAISVVADRLVVEVPSVAWSVQHVSYEKALLERIHQLLRSEE